MLITLADILRKNQKIELLGDSMHLHFVDRYRLHSVDSLFVEVDDSTFTSSKYNEVLLTIYTDEARYTSPVKVYNVPGVICLLQLCDIDLKKEELRSTKRIEVLKNVMVGTERKQSEVTLINISLGGICFYSPTQLIVGNSTLFYDTLQGQSLVLPFKVLRERFNEEKNTYIYHCQFNQYPRSAESMLEKEIVALQLLHIKKNNTLSK